MNANVTLSNRRVRTRTHGGVAGVGGDRRPYADLTALSEKWKFMASRKPQIAKVVVVRPGVWTNTLMLCTLSSYAARNAHFSRCL